MNSKGEIRNDEVHLMWTYTETFRSLNENNLVGFSDIQYFWNHPEKKRCLKTFKMEVCKTNPTPG